MSDELLRVIGVQKTNEQGSKYYQAIIGRLGFRKPWGHRILHRKCRTWTEADQYGRTILARLDLRSKVIHSRMKKAARFS